MPSATSPRASRALVAAAGALAIGGCASVVGLDELVFDREGSGGGAATSTTAGTGDTTAVTGATGTTDAASSAAGTGGAASSASSSASTGSSGGGFTVTGSSADYLALMRHYDTPFWRFDEPIGATIAADSGFYEGSGSESDWDGTYEAAGGTLALETPGVFPDDAAVSLAGGARVVVQRQPPIDYAFEFLADEGAFTLTFLMRVDAVPDPPITVASCFDADAQLGWIVRVGRDVVLERYGEDAGGAPANDSMSMPYPPNAGWHLVTIEKLSGGGAVRGYVDGVQALSDSVSDVTTMLPHAGTLVLGADPLADASTPPVTIDELALVPYGLSKAQLDALVSCLQGGSCTPP